MLKTVSESIYTNQSRDSKFHEDHSKYHLALSPDGEFVASFNTENYELRIYEKKNLIEETKSLNDETESLDKEFGESEIFEKSIESLNQSTLIKYDDFKELDKPSVTTFWSLAISNSIKANDVLVAISCFNDKDLMSEDENENLSQNLDEEQSGTDFIKKIHPTTFVISTRDNSRVQTTVDNVGGILFFLDNHSSSSSTEPDEFTELIVMNASGISKAKIHNKNDFQIQKSGLIFNQPVPKDEFHFPSTVAIKILKLYQDIPCINFLKSCVEKNYFFTEDYKTQKVEMYNLRSHRLEMTFQKREDYDSTAATGYAIFAISKNENLLAHCRNDKCITIYLMENGLEVTTKLFYGTNRILSITFIDNDEKLFIVAEDEVGRHENGKVKFAPVIIIWDFFTYKNSTRKIENLEDIFPTSQGSINYSLANSSGTALAIKDNGRVISVPHHPKIDQFKQNFSDKLEKSSVTKLPLQDIRDTSSGRYHHYHTIFRLDGKWSDAKTEHKRSIVVNNKEPWVHYKKYQRVSAYLDEKKTTQLIIGETTVQVWRKSYRNKNKRVLEYIWTNPRNRKIQIDSLSIGNLEFSLDLRIPSLDSISFLKTTIHWPKGNRVLKEACEALEFLHNRRNEPVGPKNQSKFEPLVYDTEKLIIHIIKNHPDVWRFSEIRFNLMANLIRGNRAALIQRILFENISSDASNPNPAERVCRFLHVPRLYDWGNTTKDSDLQIAIECSEGGHRRDSVIVAMLLEFYSNNAMQSTGWMFPVSKVIPLLTERHLESYIKELFYKPCFGAKEEYMDPVFVDQTELKTGYDRSAYALDVKPGLIRKQERKSLWTKVKSGCPTFKRRADGKPEDLRVVNLRVVPLPDFTVYPRGDNDQKASNWMIPFHFLKMFLKPRGHNVQDDNQSPFLRFIRQDENDVFYDNPAMEACINFKWSSARKHFIQQIILYILYAISFGLLTGVIGADRAGKGPLFFILIVIFYYLGYYLLFKEIIQLQYNGWKYFTVYHIFDLCSRVIPFVSLTIFISININVLIRSGNTDPSALRNLGIDAVGFERTTRITFSFVTLLLWFEMIFLLRFFEKSAHYINMMINIMKGVSTFIMFMALVIVGFGHSIHILLKSPEAIKLTPSGETFEVINTTTGNPIDVTINEVYNLNSTSDNYYRKFPLSIISVYFWMLGRWDQMENWTYWPVIALSITASILLVFIMQNMLIAFMTGVFDETKSNVKQAVLKFRADVIADYETIEKPFGSKRGNPRYIYYVGRTEALEEWLAKAERYRKKHKSLLAEDVHLFKFDGEDDDDDELIDGIDDRKDDYNYRDDTSIASSTGNEFLSVEGFKSTRGGGGKQQKFEFKVESVSDDEIESTKHQKKIDSVEEKINKLSSDVTNRIDVVEESLKEILKLMKEGKKT